LITVCKAWFRANQIKGIRVTPLPAPGTPKGFDNTVVADSAAPPLWGRLSSRRLEALESASAGKDCLPHFTHS
jgi:hypothetical protein